MGVRNKELLCLMGERIKKSRLELNLTQEQFSEILGISLTYYGQIERGVSSISIEKLQLLYEKFNIDPTYIITGVEKDISYISTLIEKCPQNKRYDFEQLIKYACLLANE